MDKLNFKKTNIITVLNVVAARLCFHRRLLFCSQGGGVADTPSPGQTPPRADTPLPSPCWDTRILLECITVKMNNGACLIYHPGQLNINLFVRMGNMK